MNIIRKYRRLNAELARLEHLDTGLGNATATRDGAHGRDTTHKGALIG